MNKFAPSALKTQRKTLRSYQLGFGLSVVLTLLAFYLVNVHVSSGHTQLSHSFLTLVLTVLAFFQLLIQMIFFLHLAKEKKSRWNLFIFVSTFGVVLMVVVASLWIMNHLNYNMTPMQINNYMMNMDSF